MTAVIVENKDGVAVVTLNQPETYNALSFRMADEFANAMVELASSDAAQAVIVTGAGKAFCAGGDLKWVSEHEGGNKAAFHQLAGRFHQGALEIKRMNKPVIAAINGVAAGAGFTLALGCDFRVMAESAYMLQAYTSAGLCIDGGGTFSLPRLVGAARALEIAAFDEKIFPEKALEWGLVNKVVPDKMVMEAALTMADALRARSINSFARAKRLINESFSSSLESQLEKEREAIAECGAHPDGTEGIKAFLEKRKPVFNRE